MIYAIPNQPVNMSGSLMAGCVCDELVPPTLFDPSQDTLRFQFLMDVCAGTPNLITDPDFRLDEWVAAGATIGNGRACMVGIAGGVIENMQFFPTVGVSYVLNFTVTNIRDVVNWSFGGQTGQIGSPGVTEERPQTYTIVVTATGTGAVSFQLPWNRSSICIAFVSVQEQTRDIVVDIMQGGASVLAFDPVSDPDAFTFSGRHVIFEGEIPDVTGCFSVKVTETCNEVDTVLESQQFVTTTDDCNILIRACGGGYDMLGMLRPTLEMRINAKLVHATWEATVSEEIRSNGRRVRNYGDSRRAMELRVGLQSEYAHPFLSLLPILPSFLIGQTEYIAAGDAWEPQYGDVFDGTAAITLTVYPKEELRRVVICADEPLPCPPPPNYLVQGTGPNDDLIITELGEAILLNS